MPATPQVMQLRGHCMLSDAMRTTVDLDDALLELATQLALKEGRSLSAVVNGVLAAYLAATASSSKDGPFELIVRGKPVGRVSAPGAFPDLEIRKPLHHCDLEEESKARLIDLNALMYARLSTAASRAGVVNARDGPLGYVDAVSLCVSACVAVVCPDEGVWCHVTHSSVSTDGW